MQNFDLSAKESLQAEVEGGAEIRVVAYNPNTISGDPEGDATAAGFEEYYREDTPNLIEVIFLKGNGWGA